LAQLLGIKVGHDCREDLRCAIVDRTNDVEQDTAGDPAPGALTDPRLAFEGLLAFDLTRTQRACGEARALGVAPPAGAGQGEAPEDRFILIEPKDLATAGLGREGSECKRAISEISRGGITLPGRALGA
jgi:hypothetical protein